MVIYISLVKNMFMRVYKCTHVLHKKSEQKGRCNNGRWKRLGGLLRVRCGKGNWPGCSDLETWLGKGKIPSEKIPNCVFHPLDGSFIHMRATENVIDSRVLLLVGTKLAVLNTSASLASELIVFGVFFTRYGTLMSSRSLGTSKPRLFLWLLS